MDHALLLNATYEPLKVVDWRKAITLWCQGKVEVISVYDREVHSVSLTLKLPSVVRLRRYVAIRRHVNLVPFSRANIYARDDHTCQYCRSTRSRSITWSRCDTAVGRTGRTSPPRVSAAIGARVGAHRARRA